MAVANKILATLFSGAFLTSVFVGCDDPNTSAVRPTTRPSAVADTAAQPDTSTSPVVAAYPIKPPSVISIDGRDVEFPAAKLAVIGHGTSGYTLYLCSDDPPTAIDPGYAGNSYLFAMRLPIDHLSDLPGTTWDYKPSDGDGAISGIFLHGTRGEQLRPLDVHVQFQKDGNDVVLSVSGNFARRDPHSFAAPTEHVPATAFLRTSEPTE